MSARPVAPTNAVNYIISTVIATLKAVLHTTQAIAASKPQREYYIYTASEARMEGTSKILGLSAFGREWSVEAADFGLVCFGALVFTLWLLELKASSEVIDCDAADSVSDSDSVESSQLSSTSGSATDT